jgi:hypothetical protein
LRTCRPCRDKGAGQAARTAAEASLDAFFADARTPAEAALDAFFADAARVGAA